MHLFACTYICIYMYIKHMYILNAHMYILQLIFMNNLAQNCATLLACFVQEYIQTYSRTSLGVHKSATERQSYISIGQCHHHTTESSLGSGAKFSAFGATTLAHVVLFAVVVVIGKCSCCNCANCLTQRASVCECVRLGEAENKAGVLSARRERNTVQGERSTHTHTVGRGREHAAFWFIEWPINLLLGGGCDCDGDRDSKGVRDGCSCRLGGTASATTAVVGALNLAFLKNLCWVRSLWRWHFLL